MPPLRIEIDYPSTHSDTDLYSLLEAPLTLQLSCHDDRRRSWNGLCTGAGF